MKTSRLLLGYIFAAIAAWGQPVSSEHVGQWVLVNGNLVLKLDADGTMTLRNTGESAKIALKDDGGFAWELKTPRTGRFSGDRLLLDNPQKDAPPSLATLEFRRAEPSVADAVIEHALRQQNQLLGAFANVKAKSIEAAVRNNLRQLSAAADQYYLEHGKTSVAFNELVGPDKYVKKLNPVDGEDYSHLQFRQASGALTVKTASGIEVSYDPYLPLPKK